VFDIDMQHRPNCSTGELKIIEAILERPVIEKILTHLDHDPRRPTGDVATPPLGSTRRRTVEGRFSADTSGV
jgi:hypothetical protein